MTHLRQIWQIFLQVNSRCSSDNPDSLALQEVTLPGFLFMKFMHDIFQQYLTTLRSIIEREWRKSGAKADLEVHCITPCPSIAAPRDALQDYAVVSKMVTSRSAIDVGNKLLLMIKTGRFATFYSKDTGQDNGFTVRRCMVHLSDEEGEM